MSIEIGSEYYRKIVELYKAYITKKDSFEIVEKSSKEIENIICFFVLNQHLRI